MTSERHLGRHEGLEIVAVVVGGAAAPLGVGGRRGILRVASGGLGRRFRGYICEGSVQVLLDLGAAGEVAIEPLFLARLEAVAGPGRTVRAIPSGAVVAPKV